VSYPSRKNYEAAFGNLSSSYGFGGAAPCLPTSQPSTPAKVKSTPVVVQQTVATPVPQGKNYEAAFGQLSSSYGFGGFSTPSLPKKNTKKTK